MFGNPIYESINFKKRGAYMKIRDCKIVLISSLVLIAGGCTALHSRVEMDYGNSFKQARSNQILNPEAGKNLNLVSGLDGQVAQIVIENYRKDFEKPSPAAAAFTMAPKTLGQ